MRVIKPSTVRAYAKANPSAEEPLLAWLKIARRANWTSIQDVRSSYPHADAMSVKSGRIVTVFNIGGNKFRLVVAIHYQWGRIFILRFMSHAEYGLDNYKWKRLL
jgi:mRNA interferase HigB